MKHLPRGLYAITDGPLASASDLEEAVAAALRGGAAVIQYRDKHDDAPRRRDEAGRLRRLCRAFGVPFIVNDDVALAAAVEADGVHIGRDDHALAEARRLLGPGAIIGVSCYNEFGRAEEAVRLGADYIAFGSFYPSATKPAAVRADPDLITRAKRRFELPVVAIGGITPENGGALVAAGADLLAVVSGVFGAEDVCAAARRYARLFDGMNARTAERGR